MRRLLRFNLRSHLCASARAASPVGEPLKGVVRVAELSHLGCICASTPMLTLCAALTAGFLVPTPRTHVPVVTRASAPMMVSVPRITLPEAVTSVMSDFDLKNPNAMSDAEYDAYSGAAIGGTLIVFSLLAASLGNVGGAIYCFLFAALNGGGLAAALALSKTPASEPVNSFGTKVLDTLPIGVPRLTLPSAVTDVMTSADLKDPNRMSDAEYNAYSGAAIGGTLIFFLVPGAVFIDVTGAVFDFVFAALTGGGICAFLALSNTGASEPLNKFGAEVLSVVDKVGEKLK